MAPLPDKQGDAEALFGLMVRCIGVKATERDAGALQQDASEQAMSSHSLTGEVRWGTARPDREHQQIMVTLIIPCYLILTLSWTRPGGSVSMNEA